MKLIRTKGQKGSRNGTRRKSTLRKNSIALIRVVSLTFMKNVVYERMNKCLIGHRLVGSASARGLVEN